MDLKEKQNIVDSIEAKSLESDRIEKDQGSLQAKIDELESKKSALKDKKIKPLKGPGGTTGFLPDIASPIPK